MCAYRLRVKTVIALENKETPVKIKSVLLVCAAAACLGTAPSTAHADGMVIPAYLTLSDTNTWNILADDATIMKNGVNPRYKDYWVVVNGPANGPFTLASDWKTAEHRFDPIRANGGRIFGYVHALTAPASSTYRPLREVENDIRAWVTGYRRLDGIWIDEYYPRYEIAGPSGATATFPNGTNVAPNDRLFINSDGAFNANQVDPTGGYFCQLTSWIRCTYPRLKVIGNAGGQFYSNQINYTDIVDVTCSFEQSYSYAAANSWSNLNRQNVTTTKQQMALIHSNTTDLAGAIDQAILHGYSYFYTNDGFPSGNVWGAIPPYFTSEVQYIANHG